MNPKHLELISTALGIRSSQIVKTIELLEDGATLPFIARYRKE
ncbi:MAG: Tex-like N-terminal domain-containing protein, partial [Rivularia sp. (in: cyanobacteria)]